MKSLGIIGGGAVLAIGMFAAASAAEPAAISKASLGSMGLGGMQLMSDNDGLAVRGKGAFVKGFDLHRKPKLHFFIFIVHKKFDHRGFDKFPHRSFDKFPHGGFDNKFAHKNMGGGMIWQPKQMVWNFGGGMKIH
jgi:hypothetical protein